MEKNTKGNVSSLRRPLLQSVKCYPPEVPQTDMTKQHAYNQPLKGTVVSSLPTYRRTSTIAQRAEGVHLIGALSVATWRRLYCEDARKLVIRCTLHACGSSCWKYTKPGMSDTCRHGMYHVVICKEANVKGRRSGNMLRNIIHVTPRMKVACWDAWSTSKSIRSQVLRITQRWSAHDAIWICKTSDAC